MLVGVGVGEGGGVWVAHQGTLLTHLVNPLTHPLITHPINTLSHTLSYPPPPHLFLSHPSHHTPSHNTPIISFLPEAYLEWAAIAILPTLSMNSGRSVVMKPINLINTCHTIRTPILFIHPYYSYTLHHSTLL